MGGYKHQILLIEKGFENQGVVSLQILEKKQEKNQFVLYQEKYLHFGKMPVGIANMVEGHQEWENTLEQILVLQDDAYASFLTKTPGDKQPIFLSSREIVCPPGQGKGF